MESILLGLLELAKKHNPQSVQILVHGNMATWTLMRFLSWNAIPCYVYWNTIIYTLKSRRPLSGGPCLEAPANFCSCTKKNWIRKTIALAWLVNAIFYISVIIMILNENGHRSWHYSRHSISRWWHGALLMNVLLDILNDDLPSLLCVCKCWLTVDNTRKDVIALVCPICARGKQVCTIIKMNDSSKVQQWLWRHRSVFHSTESKKHWTQSLRQ